MDKNILQELLNEILKKIEEKNSWGKVELKHEIMKVYIDILTNKLTQQGEK